MPLTGQNLFLCDFCLPVCPFCLVGKKKRCVRSGEEPTDGHENSFPLCSVSGLKVCEYEGFVACSVLYWPIVKRSHVVPSASPISLPSFSFVCIYQGCMGWQHHHVSVQFLEVCAELPYMHWALNGHSVFLGSLIRSYIMYKVLPWLLASNNSLEQLILLSALWVLFGS